MTTPAAGLGDLRLRVELRRYQIQLEDPGDIDRYCSTDPADPAAITALTYQTIASSRDATALLGEAALARWASELVEGNQVADDAAAVKRLDRMAAKNPDGHRRELRRRARLLRRESLRDEGRGSVGRFLHRNAQALVERLVEAGVRTVVLDECHHLLDYWAVVLRHLIGRLHGGVTDPVHVVGLTATLPYPGTPAEAENYRSLLGSVDIEVPAPAVVKEGELAPYRDLVRFVDPTERERRWLRDVHQGFETATHELVTSEQFVEWVVGLVVRPALDDRGIPGGGPWAAWLREQPLLSIAALRLLRRLELDVPAGVAVPDEAGDPLDLEDWCVLLERWALDVLAVSQDRADHLAFNRLRSTLAPFGLVLTERGLRRGRAPGDLVLALSEAKHEAAAEILTAEQLALGDRIRAIVVTDFDRMTSGPARLRGILDPDAGTARRLHRVLAQHEAARRLRPVLVTGRTVRADTVAAHDLAAWLNLELGRRGLDAWCDPAATPDADAYELVGHGPAWTTRTYLELLTEAFADGRTRCLVGTRGLLGEGWNAVACNTLVDLTAVATPAAAQQLRGRTLRLDPGWPRKVAQTGT